MGQTSPRVKGVNIEKNMRVDLSLWKPIPDLWRGGFVPPFRSWRWSTLRSRPRVGLSSSRVLLVYTTALRLIHLVGLGLPPGVGYCQFLAPRGPDRLGATR
jgi:hypothetical protein